MRDGHEGAKNEQRDIVEDSPVLKFSVFFLEESKVL